jgi:hypothetical protein
MRDYIAKGGDEFLMFRNCPYAHDSFPTQQFVILD